jgi:hypothetical protein
MSVSIEAVDRDLIQAGIEEVLLEAVVVEVDVVTAVVVVVLVVVVAAAAEGSAALTAEKSVSDRLSAACTADGAAPTSAPGAFDPKKEPSIDPLSSMLLSVWSVRDLNDIR